MLSQLSEGERKEILAKFDNLNHEGAQQEVALAQRKFPIVRVDGNKLYGKISVGLFSCSQYRL